MKAIRNIIATAIIASMVIIWLPFAATAADMWAETPDLNVDTENPLSIAESHAFKSEPLRVDLWAETPDLSAGKENHGVKINGEYRFINNYNPEMYAETPALDDYLPRSQPESNDSFAVAQKAEP